LFNDIPIREWNGRIEIHPSVAKTTWQGIAKRGSDIRDLIKLENGYWYFIEEMDERLWP